MVLYPMALGLIALAWHHYRSDASPADALPRVEWNGVTSQDEAMRAVTIDGVLTRIDTHLVEQCSDGSGYTEHWYPAQHRFVQHGEALRGRQAGPGHTYSGKPIVFDNRIQARIGALPHGSMSAHVTFTKPGTVSCKSGPVMFMLRRSE